MQFVLVIKLSSQLPNQFVIESIQFGISSMYTRGQAAHVHTRSSG